MQDIHQQNKAVIARLSAALYDLDAQALPSIFREIFSPDCAIHFTHPFEDLTGPDALHEVVYRPLIAAVPDLERRDFIIMAGPSESDSNWVGCGGHYVGVFEHPWLDIPPTYHPIAMRYHEFYRMEAGRVVEVQALWDIPQVMMQARAWPLSPSLGVEWMAPSPAPQNGLLSGPRDAAVSDASQQLVVDMLGGLQKHAEGGPEAMNLPAYWHPKMTWYGPAGIGTNRRISGFRNWHQIPFLKAMPNRGMNPDAPHYFFAEGLFVAITAWPGMRCTISADGWLGIAPGDQAITMRSLDFWRCENGLIRENWVLVDLLHVYDQIGIDLFSRMREFTVDRQARKPAL
ncbi:MAG: ester cyclase [Desulfosarcinaceae bacterium]|nr:ester cyclase [Desulfosarcinaceae bacterium]